MLSQAEATTALTEIRDKALSLYKAKGRASLINTITNRAEFLKTYKYDSDLAEKYISASEYEFERFKEYSERVEAERKGSAG